MSSTAHIHAKTRKAAMSALALLLASVLLAACGGSSKSSASSSPSPKNPPSVVTEASAQKPAASKAKPSSGSRPVHRGDATAIAKLTRAGKVFTACMRAKGVIPWTPSASAKKGSAGGVDTNSAAYRAAAKKCGVGLTQAFQQVQPRVAAEASKQAEAAKQAPRHNHLQPALKLALEKFAACMRAHGIKLPPPVTTGGSIFDTRGLPKNSPQFRAAEAACNSLLVAASS